MELALNYIKSKHPSYIDHRTDETRHTDDIVDELIAQEPCNNHMEVTVNSHDMIVTDGRERHIKKLIKLVDRGLV